MHRRTYLSTAGAGIGVVGGGYLGWSQYLSRSAPTELTVETLYVDRDVSSTSFSRDGKSLAWKEEYHTVIADVDTAESELADIDSLTAFVDDTDFDESYLVVVQNGMQSEPELVLDTIERRADGIEIELSIDAPRGVDDDLVIHSLLIRVTDTRDGVPETVAVDIDGYV